MTIETEFHPPVMLKETEVAKHLGISVRTLQGLRFRDRGKPIQAMAGPPWIAIGGAIRYRMSDVLNYLARCENGSGRSK